MNEIEVSPGSVDLQQVIQELNHLAHSGEKGIDKRIRELIRILKNENAAGFNLEDAFVGLLSDYPREAWKICKITYPQNEFSLTLLNTIFVINKTYEKSFKVIQYNKNFEHKQLSINFLLNSIRYEDQNLKQNIVNSLIPIVYDIDCEKIRNELNIKIAKTLKFKNELEESPGLTEGFDFEKTIDAFLAKETEKEVDSTTKPLEDIFKPSKPTFEEIVEKVKLNPHLKGKGRKQVLSSLHRYFKNPFNKEIINFIYSIENTKLRKKAIQDLLSTCKQSKNIKKNLFYLDLLKKEKKEKPSSAYICYLKEKIHQSIGAETKLIQRKLFKKNYQITRPDFYLAVLFDRIDWLTDVYEDSLVSDMVKLVWDRDLKQKLYEIMDRRRFFLKICECLEKSHGSMAAKLKNTISYSWQEQSLECLNDFLRDFLLLANLPEVASGIDQYMDPRGQETILSILANYLHTHKVDESHKDICMMIDSYGKGNLEIEDLTVNLKMVPIDKPLLGSILRIEDRERKIALLKIIQNMLNTNGHEHTAFVTSGEFYFLLIEHQLLNHMLRDTRQKIGFYGLKGLEIEALLNDFKSVPINISIIEDIFLIEDEERKIALLKIIKNTINDENHVSEYTFFVEPQEFYILLDQHTLLDKVL